MITDQILMKMNHVFSPVQQIVQNRYACKMPLRILSCFWLLFFSLVSTAQNEYQYQAGRLLEDPKNGNRINSAFLNLTIDGTPKWMIYDERNDSSVFKSVVGYEKGAWFCGEVNGSFYFKDLVFASAERSKRGLIGHISDDGQTDWIKPHQAGASENGFEHVALYGESTAIFSGSGVHKLDSAKKSVGKAILVAYSKKGKALWEQSIDHAQSIKLTGRDELFHWMVISSKDGKSITQLFKVNPKTGYLEKFVENVSEVETGQTHGCSSFATLANGDVVSVHKERFGLKFKRFDSKGKLRSSEQWYVNSQYDTALQINDVVEHPNGDILVAAHITDAIKLQNLALLPQGRKDALILSSDRDGTLRSYEQFGSKLTITNRFIQKEGNIGIVGCYEGKLNWQGNELSYDREDHLPLGYEIWFNHQIKDTASVVLSSIFEDQLKGLNIYPNPVESGRVTINLEDINLSGDIQVSIYDLEGRQRYSKALLGSTTGHLNEQLDVSQFASGVYFVRVSVDQKPLAFGKFIINTVEK
ncbi:MAG: T9SS type A sorting domain-containing protein [Cyclobacteriaceae bacterium]